MSDKEKGAGLSLGTLEFGSSDLNINEDAFLMYFCVILSDIFTGKKSNYTFFFFLLIT